MCDEDEYADVDEEPTEADKKLDDYRRNKMTEEEWQED